MLLIIHNMRELDFRQFMDVYEESNQINGAAQYPAVPYGQQLLNAEQDTYQYLRGHFFTEQQAFYAVWAPQGRYVAALRAEQYRDGFLIEALETAPAARRKGYATQLLLAVLAWLKEQGNDCVYSHVDKRNTASLAVHRKCGFHRILEYAKMIDGSVRQDHCTLLHQ